MANNRIQLKRSLTTGNIPNGGQIAQGELAINLVDRRLFTKDGTDTVIDVFGQSVNTTANVTFYNGTFTGNVNVTGTVNSAALSVTNLTTTGYANVGTTLQVGTNTATFGTSVYIVANGNIGFANNAPAHKLSVNGAAYFGSSVNVATTFAAGNTTITGFANVSSTLQVTGAAYLSSAIFTGSISGVTTLAAGNTTITGFANVSANVDVGGTLNTSASGIRFSDGSVQTAYLDPIVYAIALG